MGIRESYYKTKNYIPKVAKMLDLVVGDEFLLEDVRDGSVYKNPETGKEQKFVMTDYGAAAILESGKQEIQPVLFVGVLCGTYKIKKLLFNPKEGDRYFFIFWGFIIYCILKSLNWVYERLF